MTEYSRQNGCEYCNILVCAATALTRQPTGLAGDSAQLSLTGCNCLIAFSKTTAVPYV